MHAVLTFDEKIETPVIPKKSKGQIFKEKYGFSKTMKRNMKKHGLDPFSTDSLIAYKAIRRGKQKTVRNVQKEKHSKASAVRKGGKNK